MPVFWPDRKDRPAPGGIANTAAIGVRVIEGCAQLAILVSMHVLFFEHRDTSEGELERSDVGRDIVIGVGKVRIGRREKGNARSRFTPGGAHKERDVILAGDGYHMGCIDATLKALGYAEIEAPLRSEEHTSE